MSAYAVWIESPVPYGLMSHVQDELLEARINDAIPDTVLFLQHAPVVTLGRRGRDACLKLNAAEYAARGIELHQASRGGDVTYHGPGQLVMYPIIRLGEHEADAHGYLFNLEEIAIRTAAEFGVEAYRRKGKSGAWTDAGKMAAIGFHLKRWVTSHGMSFNVNLPLSGFDTIVPCGLSEPVTSLQQILAEACPSVCNVREVMTRLFSLVCGRPLSAQTLDLSNTMETVTLCATLQRMLHG
ncbi:MAG: lipoyl(octanoyl) transferase LipB [Kiritimatiellae bacterium]|nr:lipoyl(octanoyl) transferase LipB [Kiritimatiellia bacterium]